MNPVEACRECGRLFPYLARGVCGDCLRALDDEFHKVKEWLRENHAHTPNQVAEATDVPVARITEWVLQGRLEFAAKADPGMIDEQQRQAELRERLKDDLIRSVAETPGAEPSERAGMHTRRSS